MMIGIVAVASLPDRRTLETSNAAHQIEEDQIGGLRRHLECLAPDAARLVEKPALSRYRATIRQCPIVLDIRMVSPWRHYR